jgi:DNA-binding NarL/FixJ family response regulator
MTMQHLFLTSTPRAPSPRWLEAFAPGQWVDPAQLPTLVQGLLPTDYMLWLSSDDARWRDMLALALQTRPGSRAVLLSGSPEPAEGLAALDAGAMGYTHAYALPELLQEVATVIAHGGIWAGPELLKRLVAATSAALATLPTSANGPGQVAQNYARAWAKLSAREAQVANSVAAGKSNKEVADQLFISERTVKAHLGVAFEKLGVRDRLQLALLVATISPSARVVLDGAT